MVSALVNDEGPSNEGEQSETGLSGPGTSERVFLATRTLRVTTPEVVLGTRQTLFLPESHPLLRLVDWSFATFGVQGTVSASSSGPSLYHLDLWVPLDMLEEDALVSSLMSDHVASLILEDVVDPVVLPGA